MSEIREGETVTAFTLRRLREDVIEECAKVADEHWSQNDEITKSPGWDSACLLIAKAIRALSFPNGASEGQP